MQEPKKVHGINFLENRGKVLIVNKTNKNDVVTLIGKPHLTSITYPNKWIYFQLVKTNEESRKYISNFRFDEAAKIIYQFVWHSYCDWYIEFLKPIFDSKNTKNIEESRNMSAFIQANILVLLHPFIPFFTEKVWQDFKFGNFFKTSLMFKNWNIAKESGFKKSHEKVDWLINLVSNIRSTKVNLNVSPGSFIDMSIEELSPNKINIINSNLNLFKRLGRISIVSKSRLDKNGVKIIVGGETITLYFDQNLDLEEQKQKITLKINDLEEKMLIISKKLKNKSFLKNAPKQIVEKERNTLKEYNIELKKLNSILNSIKN